jgi:hypothetical protein
MNERGRFDNETTAQTKRTPQSSARSERRAFVIPQLTRHEPLTRITLVSGTDFGGSGGSGGTFFGG